MFTQNNSILLTIHQTQTQENYKERNYCFNKERYNESELIIFKNNIDLVLFKLVVIFKN